MDRRRVLMLGLAVLLGGFALVPPKFWWTGRMPAPPLDLVAGGPEVASGGRVWIGTDAACGAGPRTDPDDCFAILWLLGRGSEVAGLSTSFGNAPGDVVQKRMAVLVEQMRQGGLSVPPVHAGYLRPHDPGMQEPEGVAALRAALAKGPLTVLSLGPLTNLAAALEGHPELVGNVTRVVAVMGHQAGHLFHPSEGNGHGAMLGHGPIFRDLNAHVDIAALRAVLEMDLPLTLIPYDAGRGAVITGADLEQYARLGPAQGWLAGQAQDWLAFWREDVGTTGFYPFDWVAAGYLARPDLFDCARVKAELRWEWALWLVPHHGLVVSPTTGGGRALLPAGGGKTA